jgi:hypothetical protein
MHVKLTESFYIESESIDIIELSERYGEPWVEVWTKRQDRCEVNFRGNEAAEVWANWKAYMQRVEDGSRGGAEAALPKMESRRTISNEENKD